MQKAENEERRHLAISVTGELDRLMILGHIEKMGGEQQEESKVNK